MAESLELSRPFAEVPRLRLLDLGRLAAALAVVLFHYTARTTPAWEQPTDELFPLLSSVTKYGALGVYLFFMISGFVVLLSAWGRSVGSFAASRVARLYPAYWLAVLSAAALIYADRGLFGTAWNSIGPTGVVANLTMFQSALGVPHLNGVYWTLWAELKFYLLLAALMLVGVTRVSVLLLSVLWPLLGAVARVTGEQFLTEVLQPDYAPFFAIGMVLYLIYRDGSSLSALAALGLNLALAVSLAGTSIAPFYQGVAGVTLSPTVCAVLVLAFAALLALVTLTRLAFVGWRWLTVAGAITYPLYLLHELWGWELISRLSPALPPYVVLGIVIAIMLLVAYGVHRLVERPVGARLRRVLDREWSGFGAVPVAGRRGADRAAVAQER